MSTKPATLPTWNTGGANRSAPSAGQAIAGSATGDQLPSGWLNYWLYWIFSWLEYVRDGVFTSSTGNALVGETTFAGGTGTTGSAVGTGTGLYGVSTLGVGTIGVGGSTGGRSSDGVSGLATADTSAGVYGQASATSNAGPGVYGKASTPSTADKTGAAVYGKHTGNNVNTKFTYGGYFEVTGAGGSGGTLAALVGDASAAVGYGVVAKADPTAPVYSALRLEPQDTEPTYGAVGDIYVTTAGVLYICTNATGPVFTKVGAQ